MIFSKTILCVLFLLYSTSQSSAAFPNGRCYVRDCASTPYQLVTSQNIRNKFCFTINGKECTETSTQHQCCSKFRTDLHKVVFSAKSECNKSLDYVTVDGVRKGGGVFFDLYTNHAELRLTSLRMNYSTALGREICIFLKPPCETFDLFCAASTDTGVCNMAFFDPLAHTCCPICPFYNQLTQQFAPPVYTPPPKPIPPTVEPNVQILPPPSPPSSSPPPEKECPPSQTTDNICGCACQCRCDKNS